MRILAISYLFPNSLYPNQGIFVLNRLKAVQKYCEVKVINPIPWFPLSTHLRRYKNYGCIPKKEMLEGIEVFHPKFFIIPRYGKFLDALTFVLAVLPLALKIRKIYSYELIDLHWTYPDLIAGRMLARILRMKQSVTIRGKEALHPNEFTLRSKLVSSLLPRSDFVITLSEELKELSTSLGVHPQNIQVIRNGVETQSFLYKERETCRLQLGLPQHERIILGVGSLIYRKGFDRIIRALPEILNQYPDTAFYIIGSEGPEGDYRRELHELISHSGLEKKVRFVGQVDNHDLPLWYNAADLFCLASRGEGSPNVLGEALACGCPSVTTRVGSADETLSEEFMGVVVENNDDSLLSGVLTVLEHQYDRKKISAFVRQNDWDWCAKDVVRIYHKILENAL